MNKIMISILMIIINICLYSQKISFQFYDVNNSDGIVTNNFISTANCCNIAVKIYVDFGGVINYESLSIHLKYWGDVNKKEKKSILKGDNIEFLFDNKFYERPPELIPDYIQTMDIYLKNDYSVAKNGFYTVDVYTYYPYVGNGDNSEKYLATGSFYYEHKITEEQLQEK
jgi:hypothetical protein